MTLRRRIARALAVLWNADHEEHLFVLRSMDEAVRVRCAALGVEPDTEPRSIVWEGAYAEVAALRTRYLASQRRVLDLEQRLTEAEARAAGNVSWRSGRIEA